MYRLQRKLNKYSIDRQSPKGSMKISEDILEVNQKELGRLVINIIIVYNFIDSGLGVRYSLKESGN